MGAWTDSPCDDLSATVRSVRQTSSLSHAEVDISCTPSSHGTRPPLMVHRQLFALPVIILPRLCLHFLISFSRDWSMVFWRKKAGLRGLQYLHRWPDCIWKCAISRTVIPANTRWSIWPFERPAYCRVHQHGLRFYIDLDSIMFETETGSAECVFIFSGMCNQSNSDPRH